MWPYCGHTCFQGGCGEKCSPGASAALHAASQVQCRHTWVWSGGWAASFSCSSLTEASREEASALDVFRASWAADSASFMACTRNGQRDLTQPGFVAHPECQLLAGKPAKQTGSQPATCYFGHVVRQNLQVWLWW